MQIRLIHVNLRQETPLTVDDRQTVEAALGPGHFYDVRTNTLLEPDVPLYMYKLPDNAGLYHTMHQLDAHVRNNGFILEEFLPLDWKKQKQVLEWIPHIPSDVFNLVEPRLYLDSDIRQALIEKTPARLEDFVHLLRNNQEQLYNVINRNKHHGKLLSILIDLNDINMFRMLVNADGMALKSLPDHVRSDEDACRRAVDQNGLALRFASDDMRNNPEVCRLAVRENPNAYRYASETCRVDADVVRFTFRPNPNDDAKNPRFDPALVPNQVRQTQAFTDYLILSHHFRYASDAAKRDLSLVNRACQQDRNAFQYAGRNLLHDVKLVAWAISCNLNTDRVRPRVLNIANNYLTFKRERGEPIECTA